MYRRVDWKHRLRHALRAPIEAQLDAPPTTLGDIAAGSSPAEKPSPAAVAALSEGLLDLEKSKGSIFERWNEAFESRVADETERLVQSRKDLLLRANERRERIESQRRVSSYRQKRESVISTLENYAMMALATSIGKMRRGESLEESDRNLFTSLLNEPSKLTERIRRLNVDHDLLERIRLESHTLLEIGIEHTRKRTSRSLGRVAFDLETEHLQTKTFGDLERTTEEVREATTHVFDELSKIFGAWEDQSPEARGAKVVDALREAYEKIGGETHQLLDVLQHNGPAGGLNVDSMKQATTSLSKLMDTLTKATGITNGKTATELDQLSDDAAGKQLAQFLWTDMIQRSYDENPKMYEEDRAQEDINLIYLTHLTTMLANMPESEREAYVEQARQREKTSEAPEVQEKLIAQRMADLRVAFERDLKKAESENRLEEFVSKAALDEWSPYYLVVDEIIQKHNDDLQRTKTEDLLKKFPLPTAEQTASTEANPTPSRRPEFIGMKSDSPPPAQPKQRSSSRFDSSAFRRPKAGAAAAAAAESSSPAPAQSTRTAFSPTRQRRTAEQTAEHTFKTVDPATVYESVRADTYGSPKPVAKYVSEIEQLMSNLGPIKLLWQQTSSPCGRILGVLLACLYSLWGMFLAFLPEIKKGTVYSSRVFVDTFKSIERMEEASANEGFYKERNPDTGVVERKHASWGYSIVGNAAFFSKLGLKTRPAKYGLGEVATFVFDQLETSYGVVLNRDVLKKKIFEVINNKRDDDDFARDAKLRENQDWLASTHPEQAWNTISEEDFRKAPWPEYALAPYVKLMSTTGTFKGEERIRAIAARIPRASAMHHLITTVFFVAVGLFTQGNPRLVAPSSSDKARNFFEQQIREARRQFAAASFKEAEAKGLFSAEAAVLIKADTVARTMTQMSIGDRNPCRTGEFGSRDVVCTQTMLKASVGVVCPLEHGEERVQFQTEQERTAAIDFTTKTLRTATNKEFLDSLRTNSLQAEARLETDIARALGRTSVTREEIKSRYAGLAAKSADEIETEFRIENSKLEEKIAVKDALSSSPLTFSGPNVTLSVKPETASRVVNGTFDQELANPASALDPSLRTIYKQRIEIRQARERLLDAEFRDEARQATVNSERGASYDIYANPVYGPYIHRLSKPLIMTFDPVIDARQQPAPDSPDAQFPHMLDVFIDPDQRFDVKTTGTRISMTQMDRQLFFTGPAIEIKTPPASASVPSSETKTDVAASTVDTSTFMATAPSKEAMRRGLFSETALSACVNNNEGCEQIMQAMASCDADVRQRYLIDGDFHRPLKKMLEAHTTEAELVKVIDNMQPGSAVDARIGMEIFKAAMAEYANPTSADTHRTALETLWGTSDVTPSAVRAACDDMVRQAEANTDGTAASSAAMQLCYDMADTLKKGADKIDALSTARRQYTEVPASAQRASRITGRQHGVDLDVLVQSSFANFWFTMSNVVSVTTGTRNFIWTPTKEGQVDLARAAEIVRNSGDTRASEAVQQLIAGLPALQKANLLFSVKKDESTVENLRMIAKVLDQAHRQSVDGLHLVQDESRISDQARMISDAKLIQAVADKQEERVLQAVQKLETARREKQAIIDQTNRLVEAQKLRTQAANESIERVINMKNNIKNAITQLPELMLSPRELGVGALYTAMDTVADTRDFFSRLLRGERPLPEIVPPLPADVGISKTLEVILSEPDPTKADVENIYVAKPNVPPVPLEKITEIRETTQKQSYEDWKEKVDQGQDPKESFKAPPSRGAGQWFIDTGTDLIYTFVFSSVIAWYNGLQEILRAHSNIDKSSSAYERFTHYYSGAIELVSLMALLGALTFVSYDVLPFIVQRFSNLSSAGARVMTYAGNKIVSFVGDRINRTSGDVAALFNFVAATNNQTREKAAWGGSVPVLSFPGFLLSIAWAFLTSGAGYALGASSPSSLMSFTVALNPVTWSAAGGMVSGVYNLLSRHQFVGYMAMIVTLMIMHAGVAFTTFMSSVAFGTSAGPATFGQVVSNIIQPNGLNLGWLILKIYFAQLIGELTYRAVNNMYTPFTIASGLQGGVPLARCTTEDQVTANTCGLVKAVARILTALPECMGGRQAPRIPPGLSKAEEDAIRLAAKKTHLARARRLTFVMFLLVARGMFAFVLAKISQSGAAAMHQWARTNITANLSEYSTVAGEQYVVDGGIFDWLRNFSFWDVFNAINGVLPSRIFQWANPFRVDQVTFTGPIYSVPSYIDSPMALRAATQLLSDPEYFARYNGTLNATHIQCMMSYNMGELHILPSKWPSGSIVDLIRICLDTISELNGYKTDANWTEFAGRNHIITSFGKYSPYIFSGGASLGVAYSYGPAFLGFLYDRWANSRNRQATTTTPPPTATNG